jgi:hypothetical protein
MAGQPSSRPDGAQLTLTFAVGPVNFIYKGFPIFQASAALPQVVERVETVGLRNYKRSCWALVLPAL